MSGFTSDPWAGGTVLSGGSRIIPRYRSRFMKRIRGRRIAKRVTRLSRFVHSAIRAKHLDQSFSAASIGSTGSILSMMQCTIGDTDTTRDGNQITIKSVMLYYSAIVGDTTNAVRLILILDKQPNGAAPTVNDILESTGSVVTPYNPINYQNRTRFKFLMNKFMFVSTNGPEVLGGKYFKKFKKPIVVSYNETSGLPNTNALWLLAISDSAVGVPNPSVYVQSRVYFYDA